jgi:hypothetical protein
MRKICAAVLLVPALAWAQPKTAADWYTEGENQYLLGNFDKAIEAFKAGFTLETEPSKKAAYLYNVAQAYRQENDCKNALFFYRRFLSLKDNDTVKPLSAKTRKEVGDRIAELDACVQQATSISKKPPTNSIPPDGEAGDKSPPAAPDTVHKERKEVATASSSGEDGDTDVPEPTPARRRLHVISARVIGGASKVNIGTVDESVRAKFALIAGYPIPIHSKLTIDAGAAFTFMPVPYNRDDAMMTSKVANFIGLVANAGLTYEVVPKIAVRGDLGLGALFLSNVSKSPFTDTLPTDGALTMFHVRVGISGDFAITPNLIVTAQPLAFSYSPPKKGLSSKIESITTFDFMVGIGYRM